MSAVDQPVLLPGSLAARDSDRFAEILKAELLELEPGTLPLHQCLVHGNQVDESDIAISILKTTREPGSLAARIGVMFSEIDAGGSCGFEPAAGNAYCEIRVIIELDTARATFAVVQD
ncbi:MAG: glucosamine--fructose-6-phosphate aminotransferase [Gammaproteobacteria bacterium]|nr:glucosamine--fructose-6-phosphate aminotransferase [Gammaproteobacteria bacterium]